MSTTEQPTTAQTTARLRQQYRDEIVPTMMREFGYTNVMQVPMLTKAVVNVGLGEAIANAKAIDAAVNDIQLITGQKPIVTKAKRSVAAFKLRTGMPIGVKVTLRGDRMYEFYDRLVSIALPRIRDFRGVSSNSFDGRGNFTLGLTEQISFAEIDYDKVDKLRGLEVTFVTTAQTDEEGRRLLALLGMPFRAPGADGGRL
jgi:large subunit ribosomal protein L5